MRRASAFLKEFLRRCDLEKGVRRAQVLALWPQAVGPELSKLTRARSLKEGVLMVDCADSLAAYHFGFEAQAIQERLNALVGGPVVREVRFRVGELPPLPPVEPPEPQPWAEPDQRELARLGRSLEGAPAAVRQVLYQGALSGLRWLAARRTGASRCPVCDSPAHSGAPCDVCRRDLARPLVRKAAKKLEVDPRSSELRDPQLYRAARYLAERSLYQKLQELVPLAALEPQVRPLLLQTARCYLALLQGCAPDQVGEREFQRLDLVVRRVLGLTR